MESSGYAGRLYPGAGAASKMRKIGYTSSIKGLFRDCTIYTYRPSGFRYFVFGRYGFGREMIDNVGHVRLVDYLTGKERLFYGNPWYFSSDYSIFVTSHTPFDKYGDSSPKSILVCRNENILNYPGNFKCITEVPPDVTIFYHRYGHDRLSATFGGIVNPSIRDLGNSRLAIIFGDSSNHTLYACLTDCNNERFVDTHLSVCCPYIGIKYAALVDKTGYLYILATDTMYPYHVTEFRVYDLKNRKPVAEIVKGQTDPRVICYSCIGNAEPISSSEGFFYGVIVTREQNDFVHSLYRLTAERLLELALSREQLKFNDFIREYGELMTVYTTTSESHRLYDEPIVATSCGVVLTSYDELTPDYRYYDCLYFAPYGHTLENPSKLGRIVIDSSHAQDDSA